MLSILQSCITNIATYCGKMVNIIFASYDSVVLFLAEPFLLARIGEKI